MVVRRPPVTENLGTTYWQTELDTSTLEPEASGLLCVCGTGKNQGQVSDVWATSNDA